MSLSFFPLDHTGDGGDSTVRAGILMMCGEASPEMLDCLHRYEITPGVFVRHPDQHPWCNPNNWTRDQMLPYTAGLFAIGEYQPIRRFFYQRMKSFFFMQNFERDHVGTTKYPWPHFYKDEWGHTRFRFFDYADPLLPHHIWHLIIAGRIWWFYWFAPIGYLFLLIDLVVHSISPWTWEENQMIALCYVQGRPWLLLYRLICNGWRSRNTAYWTKRRQPEYAIMLERLVGGE